MDAAWPFRASRWLGYRRLSHPRLMRSSEDAGNLAEHYTDSETPEKDSLTVLEQQSNEFRRRNRSMVYMQAALLLLLFIVICESFMLGLQYTWWTADTRPLLKSPVPPVSREIRTWEDEPTLHGLRTTAEVEKSWEHLNLPTAGFVYLAHPEEYGLMPNKHVIKGAENVYSVAAYHQLHCLKIMHLTFVAFYNQESGDERLGLEHIEHCIAYIKQGVMCAGDTALEGPDVGGGTLQGWGIKHECRTWGGNDGIVEKILVLNDAMLNQTSSERISH